MDLPVRIGHDAPGLSPDDPVISVDGAWGARGLNLSHWPGHTTPPELRHDLSTGSALLFAELPAERRQALAAGAVAIVNNHYDTDGTCSLFAVRHPELALPRKDRLLAAASAGDLFAYPDDHALCVDAIVAGLADPERSLWRERIAGLDDRARHEAVTLELLDALPDILDGKIEPYTELWEPVLDAARCDVRDVENAARDELVHLDLTVVTASTNTRSSRGGTESFDPGRHALFGTCTTDRVLVIGPGSVGTTYRLIVSTLSWFDLVTREGLERPDLARLAERLNELEGAAGAAAWHAQSASGASPELWFGTAENPSFSEHAPCLLPSRLDPAVVRREVFDAARETLPLVE